MCITTACCAQYAETGTLPEGLWEEVLGTLSEVEEAFGGKFADPAAPLLLSVRSGAAVSMPGMMDTVLNLGLNDEVVEGLAAQRGERFAFDCYRRLLDMYGDVVLSVPHKEFEKEISEVKVRRCWATVGAPPARLDLASPRCASHAHAVLLQASRGVKYDVELEGPDLREVCRRYKSVLVAAGVEVPHDPHEQLRAAICAVFGSWNTPRAVKYREINRIHGLKGTAVNIQVRTG